MQFSLRSMFAITAVVCLFLFVVIAVYEVWDVLPEDVQLFIVMSPLHLWFVGLAWFAYRIGRLVEGESDQTHFLQWCGYILTLVYFVVIVRVIVVTGPGYMGSALTGSVFTGMIMS